MTSAERPVVVGVDGSPEALVAVAWAADEAIRRTAPLQVLHANIWPLIRGHWPTDYTHQLQLRGEELVQEAVDHAHKSAPTAAISGAVVTGAAAPVLITRSTNAQLVVLGSRGLGGFTGLLVGSTAVKLAEYAACPVVVVRGDRSERLPGSDPVVVGLADTEQEQPADAGVLRFAFKAAASRGTTLTVLHTTTDLSVENVWGIADLSKPPEPTAEVVREHVEKRLASLRAEFPSVAVEVLVRPARPAAALVELSASAQLVVVGCRGRGGFAGLLLGSVSQALLHHGQCPVAIVRPA